MTKTFRFGVIGCGLMGREFASAAARWLHLADVKGATGNRRRLRHQHDAARLVQGSCADCSPVHRRL